MKTNNKNRSLALTDQSLQYDHLATVSYQSITRPLGPTVDLNSFAKIQAKAKPSHLQERCRDSASTRPSASLATNTNPRNRIIIMKLTTSVIRNHKTHIHEWRSLSLRTIGHTLREWNTRSCLTAQIHGDDRRWQKQSSLRKTAPAINTLIAKTCSNSRH